jgi:hypothetical protein
MKISFAEQARPTAKHARRILLFRMNFGEGAKDFFLEKQFFSNKPSEMVLLLRNPAIK